MTFGMLHLFDSPAGRDQARLVEDHLDTLTAAESYGFDSIWIAEHHFNEYGVCGSPTVLLAELVHRTRTIRLGTAVLVLPLHHPVRVAEDFALLDVLSKGRIELGVGRGFQPSEFAGYGVDQLTSRTRFEESIEIVLRTWTESCTSFSGEHYELQRVSVRPRPHQRPHPPIWIAAASNESLRLAGRLGLNLLCSAIWGDSIDDLQHSVALYRDALVAAGHEPSRARVGLLAMVYVGSTNENAEAIFRGPATWQFDSLFGYLGETPLAHSHETYATYRRFRSANARADWRELDARGAIVCGDASRVTARLADIAEKVGITDLLCWTRVGGLHDSQVQASMQRFSRDVMPRLRPIGRSVR